MKVHSRYHAVNGEVTKLGVRLIVQATNWRSWERAFGHKVSRLIVPEGRAMHYHDLEMIRRWE